MTKCTVIGCTKEATHTWSGHPTCDDCATPARKEKMGLHTEEQLEAKREGIRKAANEFTFLFYHGKLNSDELLHYEIENLYQLLVELRSG
jgi:hypothetical protein